MKVAFTLGLLMVASLASMLFAEPKANSKGTAVSDLVGDYNMVSGEKNGEKLPADHIKGHHVRFTDSKIVATDPELKETFACTYKLDATKNPSVITMTSTVPGHKGQLAKGLIESAGDEVRLIYTLPEGGIDPPKKFKTEKGQLMIVMKKVKE